MTYKGWMIYNTGLEKKAREIVFEYLTETDLLFSFLQKVRR